MNPRRVLVTGGAGFIGSHLCSRLLTEGYDITCLDDLSTSDGRAIGRLLGHPRFHLMTADVTQPVLLDVDRIFHLACPASPVRYQQDPIRTLLTAVQGTNSVLKLACRTGARVLTTSTSEVYGDPTQHPQEEGYWGRVNPIGPRACYDEGKRAAETLTMDYARQHGVRVKIVRLFNTYGPGMAPGDGRVVPTFIRDALAGDPLRVHGDGQQTRSFCYVDDVVDALLLMMESPDPVTGPVNIGNPLEVTIASLAQRICDLTNSPSLLHFARRPVDDPERRQPDIRQAQQLLGWSPSTDLDSGLLWTIDAFRRRLGQRERI